MLDFFREFGLTAFAALATVGASWLLIRAGRRDRAQDELAKQGDRINRYGIEIRHLQHSTSTPPFDDDWDR